MSDLAVNVTWQNILNEADTHCRAIAAPAKWHNEIIESLAKKILGSYRPSHPDLLICGEIDKAPNIDLCRDLINDIALRPLESQKRLGVIMCADKLNLNAGNSLLKLAEEPPEHAYLLFLMEDSRFFLPTLRSRSRFNTLTAHDEIKSLPIPQNDSEWVEWLAKTRSPSANADEIINDLESWLNWAAFGENESIAEKLAFLKIIADKKNLSVPQLSDIIILTLREEENNYCERIFNDLW
ncbi:MAG: hypothetical protein IJT21_10970 [Synergistaceae bacterium]|nr:hypothetical protein [Synergistaceae bacterium]